MFIIIEFYKCVDDGDVEKVVEFVFKDGIDVNIEVEGNCMFFFWVSLWFFSLYIKIFIDFGVDIVF